MIKQVRERGEQAREFILSHVGDHPSDIGRVTAERLQISRQAAHKHIRNLVAEGVLNESGLTNGRSYWLQPLVEWWGWYDIEPGLAEDKVWREDVLPIVENMPRNALDIWHYGFTEMFNNAIEHSGGTRITVYVEKTAMETVVHIWDDGVGIFKKIQAQFHLDDEHHAVLELAKGKLTTDPENHTGEGIFFTSRVMNDFWIMSGAVTFSHEFGEPEDWVFMDHKNVPGTHVIMKLKNHTSRTTKKVFDKYADPDADYGFTRTVVPVRLAQYGDDKLVSRSQAKRLLARVDRFKTVVLDFNGVQSIGQAFADETFRVFRQAHPAIELATMNTSEDVRQMIARATSNVM